MIVLAGTNSSLSIWIYISGGEFFHLSSRLAQDKEGKFRDRFGGRMDG